jgi:hypothetical protein
MFWELVTFGKYLNLELRNNLTHAIFPSESYTILENGICFSLQKNKLIQEEFYFDQVLRKEILLGSVAYT